MIDDERHPDAKVGPKRQTSALYDVLAAANRPLKPAGEWNTSRVVVRGTTVEHWLNGTKVLSYELGVAGAQGGRRREQVQGRRPLRHPAEGAHPGPGSWRSGVVQVDPHPAVDRRGG